MIKRFSGYAVLLVFAVVFFGCSSPNGKVINEIRIGLHNNNVLKIQVDVLTDSAVDAYAEYWPQKGDSINKMQSNVSKSSVSHRLVLCNLLPKTNYQYHIVTTKNGVKRISKTYSFQSKDLPMWLQEQFKAINKFPKFVPAEFRNGLMLVNKRYAPGIAVLVDYRGQIRWYHMVDGMGFKVAHFTKDHTILSILGTNDEPTSYGSQILEINLLGDTLLNLKKGQGDFTNTIHHEILRNDQNQLVTLYVDKRIMDLSSIGGGKKDTVAGDGILVMDNKARKVWSWSVFDAIDPLKDARLLKSKKDWMHANSLNFDKDGNYIISFFNNGQIWKVDAHTGKVIWKFGKGGTITMPAECDFTQAHAAHINAYGNLMFFDNGVDKHQSGVFALKLDEKNKTSKLDLHIKLPKEVFNGRMGSAYMINDTTVLVCCSKRHIMVLADRKGTLLWTMETAMPSYRAEFIKGDELSPYLRP
ncbi:aryl-sulfate sulfotransferase [uncultured Mucilaginibacter sp.]|uniref:aryl-sulfate sulfotransferase n=1 Tax=uncultured Mucilaginibacter sp. TaxID=797541 RepID=UPI002600EA86|nr:aryl-sulfate sulfotransferase [uncultured Mucilaginibacter sp.]